MRCGPKIYCFKIPNEVLPNYSCIILTAGVQFSPPLSYSTERNEGLEFDTVIPNSYLSQFQMPLCGVTKTLTLGHNQSNEAWQKLRRTHVFSFSTGPTPGNVCSPRFRISEFLS